MQSRSFTKLFASITESSIWGEPDHIVKVWITMLAMADEHGFVDGTVPGLSGRSRKSIAEVEEALAKFTSPDPYSRTPDYGGRRVQAVPGGWVLLNHDKYRAIIRSEALRQQKREWATRAREQAAKLSGDVGAQSPGVEKSRNCLSVICPSGSGSDPEGGTGGGPKSHAAPTPAPAPPAPPPPAAGVFDAPTIAVDPRRSTFAPEDFEPTELHRTRIREAKLHTATLVRDFKAHEFARAYTDWNRAFSRWIETARLRAETDRAKGRSKDRPNQPNCGLTGFEGATEIR